MATENSGDVTFESAAAPGLNIVVGGRSYRFRGGVLVVPSEEADAIRGYAETHGYYKITEGATRKVALTPNQQPENDPLGPTELAETPSMRMTKADLLAMAQARGLAPEETMSKADLVTALGGDGAETDAETEGSAAP